MPKTESELEVAIRILKEKVYAIDDAPYDFENPDWKKKSRVHDWKNYTTPDLEKMWDTLTKTQKEIVSIALQDQADREEWD